MIATAGAFDALSTRSTLTSGPNEAAEAHTDQEASEQQGERGEHYAAFGAAGCGMRPCAGTKPVRIDTMSPFWSPKSATRRENVAA